MILIHKDLAFGAATLALSAGYYLLAARIPESQLADAIGPAGLPNTYALLLGVLSLILIARSLAQRPDSSGRSTVSLPRAPERRLGRRVAGMLAIGAVYVGVVPWLGYVLSLAGLILATTYYQGGRVNRQVAIVAVCGAVFCWVLFVLLMGIPQPPGLWQDVFAPEP